MRALGSGWDIGPWPRQGRPRAVVARRGQGIGAPARWWGPGEGSGLAPPRSGGPARAVDRRPRAVVWARRHMTARMMAPPLSLQEQWARRHGRRHDAQARKHVAGNRMQLAWRAKGCSSRGGEEVLAGRGRRCSRGGEEVLAGGGIEAKGEEGLRGGGIPGRGGGIRAPGVGAADQGRGRAQRMGLAFALSLGECQ